MVYALGNALLIAAAVALFFLAPEPEALFPFVAAEDAVYAFSFLLAGLFAGAWLLNAQRMESAGQLLTSWVTTGAAVVLLGLHGYGLVTEKAAARQPVVAEEQREEPRRQQQQRRQQRQQEEVRESVRTYGEVVIPAARNGNFYSKAEMNGTRFDVLIDTGASYVSLPFEVAERLALDPLNLDYTIRLRTANGISMGAYVDLDEVTVAGITVNNVRAVVSQPGALGITLLGMSYLSRIGSFKVAGNKLILGE
ncbi:MAG: TIGR02281 family clan AA aspartic protease [Pseudomonadota bacterium]